MPFSDAEWIAMPPPVRGRAAPMFRRTFQVGAGTVSAELRLCGLGWHEAHINGRRVGDHVLDPAQTDYPVRCLYVCHDVTDLLQPGANAIGVMLGDGWFHQDLAFVKRYNMEKGFTYGEPRLIAELVVNQANGSETRVCTDSSWTCAAGPITAANVYAGETHDARLERPGWDTPDFDGADWTPAECVDAPGGRLEPQDMPPIRRVEEIAPVDVTPLDAERCVVDMGQNFAGWARIRIEAPTGTTVKLRFAEALGDCGRVDTASTGVFATDFEQIDTYTCRGDGIETWEPRFTYHGFRYVEVTGWPGVPRPEDITGIVVHTDLPPAGAFACSDERLNTLHAMALWTHRSNIHGVPTDCPARERCGWLGDANMVCEYSLYNFDAERFWEKYLDDIETARSLNPKGLPPNIAPGLRRCGTAKPDWMAALILIPWVLHVYRGNGGVLARHWDGMRTVIDHFHERSEGGLLDGGYGDWCDPLNGTSPTHTPEALTTTVWYHECARIMAGVAARLGDDALAADYAAWTAETADAFHARWFDADQDTFGSQTADAMALHFGLAPREQEDAIVASLVRNITEAHATHSTVGIMGLRVLFEVLTRRGHGDVALALMRQNTFPSFGHIIGRGATTLWEFWGEDPETYEQPPRSLNHPMMGGFDNWFFNTLAGIRPDPEHAGFKHFFLDPHPVPGLDWLRAHHDSPHGRIRSEWRVEDGRFAWEVEVPDGTSATATMPGSGHLEWLEPGVHHL